MAHSDVRISASGIPPGTPIGATVTYQVGSIPTATVHLAPPGDMQVGKQGFGNMDQQKRTEAELQISVNVHTAPNGGAQRSLKFKGLLDGMSLSNMVGSNNYEAVIKNKAQTLLELTTIMPGLVPTSVNPYKNTDHAMVTNDQGGSGNEATIVWGKLTREINDKQSPLGFYTDLMKLIIQKQKGGWEDYRGTDGCLAGGMPFDKIFGDGRYKKALSSALEIFSNIDISAVSQGTIGRVQVCEAPLMSQMMHMFIQGSTVLLENYMSFLNTLGCSMIFSNSRMIVVPHNSVIKQGDKKPGKGQLQSSPNAAGPADYVSYSYSDNGYRDISMIIVTTGNTIGGHHLASAGFDTGGLSYFAENESLSKASGVLVVEAHPFMTISASAPSPIDSKEARQNFDDKSHSMYKKKRGYASVRERVGKVHAEKAQKKKEASSGKFKEVLDNYAETKFYQTRFRDRHGSITMDFNPNWAPGTGGSLYVRETNSFIHFYVNSVTHRVDTSAPNGGTAMTTVNFSCGRFGESPAGAKTDKYLGYNTGVESAVQASFIEDSK